MSGVLLITIMGVSIYGAWRNWPTAIKKIMNKLDNTEWSSTKKLTSFVFCLATVQGIIRAAVSALLYLLVYAILAALFNLPLIVSLFFFTVMFGYAGYTTLRALQFCVFELSPSLQKGKST